MNFCLCWLYDTLLMCFHAKHYERQLSQGSSRIVIWVVYVCIDSYCLCLHRTWRMDSMMRSQGNVWINLQSTRDMYLFIYERRLDHSCIYKYFMKPILAEDDSCSAFDGQLSLKLPNSLDKTTFIWHIDRHWYSLEYRQTDRHTGGQVDAEISLSKVTLCKKTAFTCNWWSKYFCRSQQNCWGSELQWLFK